MLVKVLYGKCFIAKDQFGVICVIIPSGSSKPIFGKHNPTVEEMFWCCPDFGGDHFEITPWATEAFKDAPAEATVKALKTEGGVVP